MSQLATLRSAEDTTTLLALVPEQMESVFAWQADLRLMLAAGKAGRMALVAAHAEKTGVPAKQVYKKLLAYEKQGIAGLIDKRHHSKLWASRQPIGLPPEDQETVKAWCGVYQRSSEAGINALRRAWLEQRVPAEAASHGLAVPHTTQPVDISTGYPVGWSVRNLQKFAPSEYQLKAMRIGRSAASACRALVYTTRRELYVGQFRMWDDMWHDHEVVDFDQRKRGRPLEFHGLDLASACKIAWGMRTRTERADGSHDGLEGGDFRFLLAGHYSTIGFHPRGTTEVVENGTAAIPDWMEQLLHDATGGMITVNRAGMTGAAAHAGQYAGRAKGNFRLKAALESLGNLIHNELAALPGQVGKDRDHCPEQMNDGGQFVDRAGNAIGSALGSRRIDPITGRPLAQPGLLKHQDALLMAVSLLPPERAEWLRHKLCMMHQFRLLVEEVYARINARRDHDLEGWDERWVHDPRAGRMRKLSPVEVFTPGARMMQPLNLATVALILAGGDGLAKLGRERTVRSGMFELNDGEVSGDALRFDASELSDREKYMTVLNPFDAGRLFIYDASGGFVTAAKRIYSVNRADVEAIERRMGEAAKAESALLQPLRIRHFAAAKIKLARHEENIRTLGGSDAAQRAHKDFTNLADAALVASGERFDPGAE